MAGVRVGAGDSVVYFGAVLATDGGELVTVSGHSSALPGTDPGSVKVTPLEVYPSKGRGTGGVRCHRFLKGEDALTLAWAGVGPARAAAANGVPLDLPAPRPPSRRQRHPLPPTHRRHQLTQTPNPPKPPTPTPKPLPKNDALSRTGATNSYFMLWKTSRSGASHCPRIAGTSVTSWSPARLNRAQQVSRWPERRRSLASGYCSSSPDRGGVRLSSKVTSTATSDACCLSGPTRIRYVSGLIRRPGRHADVTGVAASTDAAARPRRSRTPMAAQRDVVRSARVARPRPTQLLAR